MAMDVTSLIRQPGAPAPAGPGPGIAAPAPGNVFGHIGSSLGGSVAQAGIDVTRGALTPAFNQAVGAYTAAAQPDYLQNALQRAGLQRQGEYTGASIGLNKEALNLRYGSDVGDANTNIGQNAIALAAARRQPGVLDSLDTIQQQQFGNQRDALGLRAGQDTRQLQSQATAAGSRMSGGTRQGYRDIYGNLVNGVQGIDLENNKFNVNSAENKAQAQDRIKTLELEAGNLGMKPAQLEAMLKNQLAQQGLDATYAYGKLMDGLKSNDIDSYKIYQSILSNAQNYVGSIK